MTLIDLRSDTVTRPTDKMRQAMVDAPVGDDVYKEDPTVNRLEELAAAVTGKEAALFCSSGTQSNLLALMTHCRRGDEYIVGQTAHTYKYEAGGAAVLGSIQPQPIELEPNGTLDLKKVEQAIKPDDFHFARTRLLCLENTQSGKVLPLDYLKQASRFALEHQLGRHLDGARAFNAAVKLQIDIRQITQLFDTVSCCLSKGLGAPVGSVLCGPAPFIKEAAKWRKMVGGGMRQAGILAAAGIYALENHIDRLSIDHDNAQALARGIADIPGLLVNPKTVQTNMIFADIGENVPALAEYMETQGILIDHAQHLRMVTHLDITQDDIAQTIKAFHSFYDK